jgi:hypothetical protein
MKKEKKFNKLVEKLNGLNDIVNLDSSLSKNLTGGDYFSVVDYYRGELPPLWE